MQPSVMRRPRGRLTIGGLMTAVAVAAGLLALPTVIDSIVIALSIPILSSIGARWLVLEEHQRLAGYGFWAAATITNLIAVGSCIAPNRHSYWLVCGGLVFVAIPTIASLGRAWLLLLNREEAVRARSREAAGYLVWVLAALPM